MNEGLKGRLLEIGLEAYDGHFAGGQPANNKLNLDYDRLCQYPDLHDEVVSQLCTVAEAFDPEFVIGVPNGATGLAQAIATHYKDFLYNPLLKKDENSKAVRYASSLDLEMVEDLSHGILIEDVLNRRSSTQRTLRIAGLAPRIAAVIGIFDRSIPQERQRINKPIRSLVAIEIPAMLDQDSELWDYAQGAKQL